MKYLIKQLEKAMSAEDYVELAVEPYQDSTVLRFLANLLPGGGALDVVLTKTFDDLVQKREKQLFDDLEGGKAKLSDECSKSNAFLHRFAVTRESVRREAEESKIHLFANLLLNGQPRTS